MKRSKRKDSSYKERITSEKPVSLDPVGFEDALKGLLSIPPSQESKDEERKQDKPDKKRSPILSRQASLSD